MTLKWTESAEADLDALVIFAAHDGVAAAIRMDVYIREEAARLVDFPQLGKLGRRIGTRELVLARYNCVLVYALREDSVAILRLIHGKQSWAIPN